MLIDNAAQARAWLASWNFSPSRGILSATLAGLQKSYNIASSYNHWEYAQAVAEAIMVLEHPRVKALSR